jgi:hypothetical protein
MLTSYLQYSGILNFQKEREKKRNSVTLKEFGQLKALKPFPGLSYSFSRPFKEKFSGLILFL